MLPNFNNQNVTLGEYKTMHNGIVKKCMTGLKKCMTGLKKKRKKWCDRHFSYRDMPIKGAPSNKGAPYGFRTHYTLHSDQNRLNFLNNRPIFNPKPPLESPESQLLPYVIRLDLAIAPCAFIRHITVYSILMWIVTKALFKEHFLFRHSLRFDGLPECLINRNYMV